MSPTAARRTAAAFRKDRARRYREAAENDQVLVGTKVAEGHANYAMAYNMLTGIRVAVSRCNAKMPKPIQSSDFKTSVKLAFDVSGNEPTPSTKYDFKFKDYAPEVFRSLRILFHVDPADYLVSLTAQYIVSELGSPGKSGSFLYFSRDYRFIIKTIHKAEHKLLRNILKDYYYHVEANPNTLISQFYGLHRVKLPYGRRVYFIVMNNLFPPNRDIHVTYDLKGSTAGRFLNTAKTKTQKGEPIKGSQVRKDLNWIHDHRRINLGPSKRQLFLSQLECDISLLKRLGIMDYSLLIGIHDLTRGNSENIRNSTLKVFQPELSESDLITTDTKERKLQSAYLRHKLKHTSPKALVESSAILPLTVPADKKKFLFYADDGGFIATDENDMPLNELYFLGVIDCLTKYGFRKRMETLIRGMGKNRHEISAVPAVEYGNRFMAFIRRISGTLPADKST
ncbi:hypothetical protein CANCADRAFT_25521 [Tortispora caseinolytica NRRL Y-17796]|uniref:1-phosphatidylinositol-4-phosphate 5-kinase n=1 Tax=Tortispora caseinolytica NRRL Y-17796 TaxID=767744 RepID=A0A1E4THN8_9ASCO|nr:hypothetical protein CANCADRAFT_25521 [Tortispora caseinolytica NRRL Y-17796]